MHFSMRVVSGDLDGEEDGAGTEAVVGEAGRAGLFGLAEGRTRVRLVWALFFFPEKSLICVFCGGK